MKFGTIFNIILTNIHKTTLYEAIEEENIEIVRLLQNNTNPDNNTLNI